MRNENERQISKMDVYTTLCCGCLLVAGGLIALVTSLYGCLTFVDGVFNITEVIISSCVLIFGVYLLIRSLPKLLDMIAEKNNCEAPFYYELEPVLQRRDLPPIPKDIGRVYDPVILDKV